MNFARIVDGVAVEVVQQKPADIFTADIAALFTAVPAEVRQQWWRDDNGAWQPEVIPPQVEPPPYVMPEHELAALVAGFVRQVDVDVDAIFVGAIGERGIEYTDAAMAAQAYKDAGYTGVVPDEVDSWAAAAQQSAQWAADDILAARDRLNVAKQSIRRHRLKAKEDARRAADLAGVEAAKAEWAAFVKAIRAQLGLPA